MQVYDCDLIGDLIGWLLSLFTTKPIPEAIHEKYHFHWKIIKRKIVSHFRPGLNVLK